MMEVRVEGLRSALAAGEEKAEALVAELRMRPSLVMVEDLKQQIRMLQAVG